MARRPRVSWILTKLQTEYGSWYAAAQALGGSNQRIYQWKARGYVPETAALAVEALDIGIDARSVLEEAAKGRKRRRRNGA